MLKNIEGKEVDAFEQEMEYRITNLEKETVDRRNAPYSEGVAAGYRYALAIYRECREVATR